MVIADVLIDVILCFEILVTGWTTILLVRAIMDILQVAPHGKRAGETLSTDHTYEAIIKHSFRRSLINFLLFLS